MKKLLILGIVCCLPSLSCANKVQSLARLQQMAAHFLTQELEGKVTGRVEVKAGLIDPRLRLPHCPEANLETFLPDYVQNPAQTNVVGVRCSTGSRWSVYVPVDVDVYTQIVVLTHAISRGQMIRPRDVSVVEYDTTAIHHGFYQDPKNVVGKAARRNLSANRPIMHSDIIIPDVVKRGDSVTISAQFGRLSVQARGVAMDNGSLGEVINVKNMSSNKVLQAKVTGQKSVKIEI